MSRLATLDKALVLILVPIWVVCFGLTLVTMVRGGWHSTVYIERTADYPVVVSLRPWLEGDQPLQVGDRILRVGEADARGFGGLRFTAWFFEAAKQDGKARVRVERSGEELELAVPGVSGALFWPFTPAAVTAAAVGLLLMLRSRPTPLVRALFLAAMCLAIHGVSFFFRDRVTAYAAIALQAVTLALAIPLLGRALLMFPHGEAPRSRLARWGPWFFASLCITGISAGTGFPLRQEVAWPATTLLLASALALGLWILTRNWLAADPVERRQIKWVVLGAYLGALPTLVGGLAVAVDPSWIPLYSASTVFFVLIPIGLFVSITRFNLFDVDRLISSAATFNVLAVLLGAAILVAVPRIAEAASQALGIDAGTGQVALSLLLAAGVVPAERRLRVQIDRIFFKERYALDHGIAELLSTLSTCSDARELTERVGEGLSRLLRPEACVVYALVEESYVPVFAEGRAVPPAFGAASLLVGALTERRKPLALGEAGRRPDEAPLGPFDRAALETLQAEVVVPVRQNDALAAFLCLGPKGSGDVYTSTDLSLLTAIAETASRELRRFDQEEVIRAAQAMQESLRRYVPGAIAEQLSSGSELASGERHVSVLFVDIRGYTSFSESREAGEIFSTINRYTETVSEIVRKHGGSVVEFNGDGMMTVFGAPRELAHKERAAVESGREIVAAVGSMPVEDAQGGQTKLSVGVGIATGKAFVGNIQAVDRMIWSAIGNTTNLAARLQSLTRDLDASLVIDHETWEKAQPSAADFERRSEVPIRGRHQTQNVYALPLPARS